MCRSGLLVLPYLPILEGFQEGKVAYRNTMFMLSFRVDSLEPFSHNLLEVFRRNSGVTRYLFGCQQYNITFDRVTLPLLLTLDLLLSNAVFDVYLHHSMYICLWLQFIHNHMLSHTTAMPSLKLFFLL